MTTDSTPAGSADPADAVIRPATLGQYALQAGFSGVEILPLQAETLRFYRLSP
jgi:hypothetical protein